MKTRIQFILILLFFMIFLFCFFTPPIRSTGAELTSEQRRIADEVVGEHISSVQESILKKYNLDKETGEFSDQKQNLSQTKPIDIGIFAKDFREKHVPIPKAINDKILKDIDKQPDNTPAERASLKVKQYGGSNGLKNASVDALIEIESPECIPILEELANSKDTEIATKAKFGALRLRCRLVDKIYSPQVFPPDDDARLYYLTIYATYEAVPPTWNNDPVKAELSSKALVKIGGPAISYLRDLVPSYSHGDGLYVDFNVSRQAAVMLMRLGRPAIPALIDALCDEHEHGRRYAFMALQEMTGENPGTDYKDWSSWYLKQKGNKK